MADLDAAASAAEQFVQTLPRAPQRRRLWSGGWRDVPARGLEQRADENSGSPVGQGDLAAGSIRQLLTDKQEFLLAFAREKLFYLKRPEQSTLYFEGLALAGLDA